VSAAALDRAPLDSTTPADGATTADRGIPVDGASPAGLAVAEAARAVQPIGLAELTDLAELQTRVDRKYFVPADVFGRLVGDLAGQLRVLEIGGRRTFGYESVYFDTPQLTTYRAHLQRRRHRFKARTRTYTDSGLCMFEVKLPGARGQTVKHRVPPAQYRAELTDEALGHLRTTLCEADHQDLPSGMRPTLVTTYRRTTFVFRTGEARVTCDVALACLDLQHEVRDTGTHVLVETKSALHGSPADWLLRELGVRPASVSKYCLGMAALHPELPSNPWHPTLRRYFELLAPGSPGAPTPRTARQPRSSVHSATVTSNPGSPRVKGTLSVPQFISASTTPHSRVDGEPPVGKPQVGRFSAA
jgi:hypothetical protein